MNTESRAHESAPGELSLVLTSLAARAREASRKLAMLGTARKNAVIRAIGEAVLGDARQILEANAHDIAKGEARALSPAMLDRLRLTPARLKAAVEALWSVAELPDPVGEILREWTRPNGLRILKRRVPIGVIGIIYESRPNVTLDAAVLCLKAGNASFLRGGSEAHATNTRLAASMGAALATHGLDGAVALVPSTAREAVPLMCSLERYIDLLIPRGGHALIESVVQHARMPVIKHYNGICHIFVHREADLAMAEKIIINAKCQRPGVCNAMETLLVDAPLAPVFLPQIVAALRAQNVEIRADATACALLSSANLHMANPADWDTEHLALIVNLRVVDGTEAAIGHITEHGSRHSDGIITENSKEAEFFLGVVDSSTVYWNASTRFTDGGEFGFGAEIGISTDKLHARGPMGLEELCSYKYEVHGTGQTRE
ncbi:MAG: glutamate-5-semialdehyde dehydrogenase [Puniceicoccales bacterium]|jgi:glutamate-5-semialdehyde dehydrogenase|nr:glutamate-5-semialdehyde dehydrogenase [Puniceicoccales bacterium]